MKNKNQTRQGNSIAKGIISGPAENKFRYCKRCKKKTLHLKCGFGTIGGLIGNARYRCLICGEERI